MVGEQIKANAEVLESFEMHQFVDPPFSFSGGIDRAIQVFGGLERLEQVLSDLNTVMFASPDAGEAPSTEHATP